MSNVAYFAVTPSDTVDLLTPSGLIYVGVTGDIAVLGNDADTAVTFKAAPVGWFKLPFPAVRVMATGTTATNLVACPRTLGTVNF